MPRYLMLVALVPLVVLLACLALARLEVWLDGAPIAAVPGTEASGRNEFRENSDHHGRHPVEMAGVGRLGLETTITGPPGLSTSPHSRRGIAVASVSGTNDGALVGE